MTNLLAATIISAALIAAILLPRIFDLGAFQAADEKMWIANTQGFTRNLASFKWGHLLQQPHPGITVTWLGSLTIHASSLAVRKLPLAIGQSILIGLTGYIFYRLWGSSLAALLTLLLALNPILIAHTRVYAMDSLLAHFLLLSVACLLLWRRLRAPRYLIFAAAAAALAVLSKLPGIIIVPITLAMLFKDAIHTHRSARSQKTAPLYPARKRDPAKRGKLLSPLILWLAAFCLTIIVVFPSLALNFPEVKQRTLEFLLEGDAQDIHHEDAGYWYYLKSLVFFSTPLQLIAILVFPLAWRYSPSRAQKEAAAVFLLSAAFFIAAISLGAKKGDRYILPAFLFLDAYVALSAAWLTAHSPRVSRVVWAVIILGLAWQAADITRLHPYTLAYVNPLTKSWYGDRRLGWGEGLDLAAKYLNAKPGALNLTVAAPYPTEFAYSFIGRVIPLNHYAAANPDYIILYRSLLERGHDTWETEVRNEFQHRQPEKTFTLNGLPYVWIYRAPITAHPAP